MCCCAARIIRASANRTTALGSARPFARTATARRRSRHGLLRRPKIFPAEYRGHTFIGQRDDLAASITIPTQHGSTRVAREEPDFWLQSLGARSMPTEEIWLLGATRVEPCRA